MARLLNRDRIQAVVECAYGSRTIGNAATKRCHVLH
jgi:hypothetical protein